MSRLIYACRFDVPKGVGTKAIVEKYEEWIKAHYSRRFGGMTLDLNLHQSADFTSQLPLYHRLEAKTYSNNGHYIDSINWSFPSEHDATLIWQNEIRIGLLEKSIALEHTISLNSKDFLVAPARIDMGSPRIIRTICKDQAVHVGEMQILATPYQVQTEGVEDFILLLTSPLRRLPLVFLSPYAAGGRNEIDSDKLAAELAGVAIVVEAKAAATTWDIADRIGRPLSCFDGAARIYWPGFSLDDEPRRHPLYLASRIFSVGTRAISSAIQRLIFSVATFRFVADPRMNAIVRAAEDFERLEKIVDHKSESNTDWEQFALELDEELTKTKGRLTELEAENENLRANQSIIFSAEPSTDPDVSQPSREPASNQEAVEFADADCKNLVFLESAASSAAECPFRRPQEVYDALRDLDDIASQWQADKAETGSGGDFRQHLINKGWGKRCSMHISDTTRKRHENDYTFEYSGARRLFEPHITLGSGDPNMCASIHFILDQDCGKIVIAHAGRHLPNTKT